MNKYAKYCNSAKSDVLSVNKDIRGGIKISPETYFDYLFKKELLILEGIFEKPGSIYYLRNDDNGYLNLASFYARVMFSMMVICKNGIRFKDIEYMASFITRGSKKYGYKYKSLVHETKNGVVVIMYSKQNKSMYNYCINDEKSFCTCFADVLGGICSQYVGFNEYWYKGYLLDQIYCANGYVASKDLFIIN